MGIPYKTSPTQPHFTYNEKNKSNPITTIVKIKNLQIFFRARFFNPVFGGIGGCFFDIQGAPCGSYHLAHSNN